MGFRKTLLSQPGTFVLSLFIYPSHHGARDLSANLKKISIFFLQGVRKKPLFKVLFYFEIPTKRFLFRLLLIKMGCIDVDFFSLKSRQR